VDRAIDDLRRRVPVIITDGVTSHAVAAAELANDATLAWIGRLGAAAPGLAITAHRARTLHIRPTGAEVVVIVGAQGLPESMGLPAAAIATLVDPTADLAHPLRGPFEVAPGPAHVGFGAALVLNRLARLLPAAVVVPVNTGDDPAAFAARESLLCVTVEDLESYETEAATALIAVSDAHVPLGGAADARVIAFRPADGGIEHLAIVIGDPSRSVPVLVRLHSECFTGDLLASLRCDCGQQLRGAVEVIAAKDGGVLLYLAQEGRGIGLINKLRAYQLQDQGYDTIEANQRLGFEADERIFLPAAEMLRRLGFEQVRLLTNNPHKVTALQHHGIDVVERVAHSFPPTDHSVRYLETKATRSGHLL
jgi:GTP cyclohydrolase II